MRRLLLAVLDQIDATASGRRCHGCRMPMTRR
jgi:hypothetical protein